jgi:hypothetical protein
MVTFFVVVMTSILAAGLAYWQDITRIKQQEEDKQLESNRSKVYESIIHSTNQINEEQKNLLINFSQIIETQNKLLEQYSNGQILLQKTYQQQQSTLQASIDNLSLLKENNEEQLKALDSASKIIDSQNDLLAINRGSQELILKSINQITGGNSRPRISINLTKEAKGKITTLSVTVETVGEYALKNLYFGVMDTKEERIYKSRRARRLRTSKIKSDSQQQLAVTSSDIATFGVSGIPSPWSEVMSGHLLSNDFNMQFDFSKMINIPIGDIPPKIKVQVFSVKILNQKQLNYAMRCRWLMGSYEFFLNGLIKNSTETDELRVRPIFGSENDISHDVKVTYN